VFLSRPNTPSQEACLLYFTSLLCRELPIHVCANFRERVLLSSSNAPSLEACLLHISPFSSSWLICREIRTYVCVRERESVCGILSCGPNIPSRHSVKEHTLTTESSHTHTQGMLRPREGRFQFSITAKESALPLSYAVMDINLFV